MVKKLMAGLALMAVVGVTWGTAHATIVGVGSRVALNSQGIIMENYGFEDFTGSDFYAPGNPWTAHSVTYNNGNNLIIGPASGYAPLTNVMCNDYWTPNTGTINGTHNMFAFDVSGIQTNSVKLTVETNLNTLILDSLTVLDAATGMSFFGFTATGSGEYFTAFRLDGLNGGAPVIDNVTLGSLGTAAVPEPTTLLLVGAGLGVIGFLRRRK